MSSVVSSVAAKVPPPALFTRTSITPPATSRASVASVRTAAVSLRSAVSASAVPPSVVMRSTTSPARASSRPLTITE